MAWHWVEVDVPPGDAQSVHVNLSDEIGVWIFASSDRTQSLVLLDRCAHQGRSLVKTSRGFKCEAHRWTYDSDGKNRRLNGPALQRLTHRWKSMETMQVRVPGALESRDLSLSTPVQVEVISHSALSVTYRDVNVVFDPWTRGTAYYGAWKLFPEPAVQDINPTAVVITHPHPDHCHPESLMALPPGTQVYYPRFPSEIIDRVLNKCSHLVARPCGFQDEVTLTEGLAITFLRPQSFWEDSAVLLRAHNGADDFVLLNQNDAGAPLVGEVNVQVDLLCAGFDGHAASGYPLVWESVSRSQAQNILEDGRYQVIESLIRRAHETRARYFLPFAGHWRLAQSSHAQYSQQIPHNTFPEIVHRFWQDAPNCRVVDLLPGESITFPDEQIRRSATAWASYLSEDRGKPSHSNLRTTVPLDWGNVESAVRSNLLLLQASGSDFSVEPVDFFVGAQNQKAWIDYVALGESNQDARVCIELRLTEDECRLFLRNDFNWNWLGIGYWGKWSRRPNVFTPNFMRLLAMGEGLPQKIGSKRSHSFSEDSLSGLAGVSISQVLEKTGERGLALLNRLGLPCSACALKNHESLGTALEVHDVNVEAGAVFLRELLGLLQRDEA